MTRITVVLVLLALFPWASNGQEADPSGWSIRPSLSLVKFLPGKEIDVPCAGCYGPIQYRYSGTGVGFGIRAVNPSLRGVAFTLGTGVHWFYSSGDGFARTGSGVGATVHGDDFNTFPLSAGVQLFFPRENPDNFMGFIGADASFHLVEGDVPFEEQTRFGYDVLAGFAVKVFEVGIRYATFSDMENFGVHFGIRLPSFSF